VSDLFYGIASNEIKFGVGKWELGWEEVSALVGALNLGSATNPSI
jgi:hypothetical protein